MDLLQIIIILLAGCLNDITVVSACMYVAPPRGGPYLIDAAADDVASLCIVLPPTTAAHLSLLILLLLWLQLHALNLCIYYLLPSSEISHYQPIIGWLLD